MAATLGSVDWSNAGVNPAGLKTKVYFCPHNDIATFPALPTTGTLAEYATLGDPYVCKTGKRFFWIYITMKTGEFVPKMSGDPDHQAFENEISGNYPDVDATIMGLLRSSANENFAIIFEDLKGRKWTIGYDPNMPAKIKMADGKTGKNPTDTKGVNITFEHSGDSAFLYDEAVPLTPAS